MPQILKRFRVSQNFEVFALEADSKIRQARKLHPRFPIFFRFPIPFMA